MELEEVCRIFGLGKMRDEPVEVAGGLSNQMWRVVTDGGAFAVKRMIVNAERPGFVDAVEASFAVERRAWSAGIPMPEPVPYGGRALARVGGGALVRVHRWVDGSPADGLHSPADGLHSPADGLHSPADGLHSSVDGSHSPVDGSHSPGGTAVEAVRLLARIHDAGRGRRAPAPQPSWAGEGWPADIRELARRVGAPPAALLVVDSHGDLDPKNTLRRRDGTLIALDWDAAGPVAAVHEAVGVAIDWAGGEPAAYREAIRAYGRAVPAEPWIFGGWLAAQGGWLDYQAGTIGGEGEVERTLHRVREMEALVTPG